MQFVHLFPFNAISRTQPLCFHFVHIPVPLCDILGIPGKNFSKSYFILGEKCLQCAVFHHFINLCAPYSMHAAPVMVFTRKLSSSCFAGILFSPAPIYHMKTAQDGQMRPYFLKGQLCPWDGFTEIEQQRQCGTGTRPNRKIMQ